MQTERLDIMRSWLAARWSGFALRTPAEVRMRQARLWRAMAPVIARTPAVSALAGRPLTDFPVTRPDDLRERFGEWNTLRLTEAEVAAAAAASESGGTGEVRPGVIAGFSSGSSGRRGLFVTDASERAGWVGHILARLLPPDVLIRPTRIALCLRADNRLYRDVEGAGPFSFMFTSLDLPGAERFERLRAFAPDVLIAPAHVLADLARRSERAWPLRRLFYGAEPMGEAERAWIATVLGARPDPIYQATEGFLGVACRLGTLHLNDDVLVVEREAVSRTNRFIPIVTDLRRTTQPMIRVRLPDLLEPLAAPCPCGSPLTAVHPVEGRLEDLWRWPDAVICPREAEATISLALGPEQDWRAVASSQGVSLWVDRNQGGAAMMAIKLMLAAHGVAATVTRAEPHEPASAKRRRIRWSQIPE